MASRGWVHIQNWGIPNSVEYDLRYEMLGYCIPPQYILVSRITKPTKVYKANNSIHLAWSSALELIVALLSELWGVTRYQAERRVLFSLFISVQVNKISLNISKNILFLMENQTVG